MINTTREIYRRGWTTIKLYFMIGHPSETLEDVQAIADLCKRVIDEGRKVVGMEGQAARRRQHLRAQAADAVPMGLGATHREQILAKQALLKRELRDRNIKLSWTEPDDTLLEAWLSRGDRRMAEVIYSAWKNGAKFDAWDEGRKADAWTSGIRRARARPAFYTHRQRRTDEVFPWDHITRRGPQEFPVPGFPPVARRPDPRGLPPELLCLRHPAHLLQHAARKSRARSGNARM